MNPLPPILYGCNQIRREGSAHRCFSVKMPYIITCSDKQRLTFKNLMSQRKDNDPVIYADKQLDLNEIKVINTPVPIVFDKLQTQKLNVWNECLTALGINNANTEKRERLITNEVNANNEVIEICSDVMLKAREEACKRINEMFGLNISVRRRTRDELEEIGVNLIDDNEVVENAS